MQCGNGIVTIMQCGNGSVTIMQCGNGRDVLCLVVRVAIVVKRQQAAVAHVLDGVQRNAQLAVMRYDSAGAVRVAGVAPATAVRRHGAGTRVE